MKVWVVERDDEPPIGIFSSLSKAQDCARRCRWIEEETDICEYDLDEITPDSGCD